MDITGIAKSHHADIPKTSSKKEWKLSESLREQIAEYAREDAAQGIPRWTGTALWRNTASATAPWGGTGKKRQGRWTRCMNSGMMWK